MGRGGEGGFLPPTKVCGVAGAGPQQGTRWRRSCSQNTEGRSLMSSRMNCFCNKRIPANEGVCCCADRLGRGEIFLLWIGLADGRESKGPHVCTTAPGNYLIPSHHHCLLCRRRRNFLLNRLLHHDLLLFDEYNLHDCRRCSLNCIFKRGNFLHDLGVRGLSWFCVHERLQRACRLRPLSFIFVPPRLVFRTQILVPFFLDFLDIQFLSRLCCNKCLQRAGLCCCTTSSKGT